MLKKIREEKGFTLIELMIVILIIGILVAIAVPVYNSARSSAQRGACQDNMRTIDSAIMQYSIAKDGAWPSGMSDLVPTYLASPTPQCPIGPTDYNWDATVTPPTVTCPNGHPKR